MHCFLPPACIFPRDGASFRDAELSHFLFSPIIIAADFAAAMAIIPSRPILYFRRAVWERRGGAGRAGDETMKQGINKDEERGCH